MRLRDIVPRPVRRSARRALHWSGAYLVVFHFDGLAKTGWARSSRAGKPVTREGAPLPWYTYGATAFLQDRLRPTMRVFEFGAGHSSLWYADRVSSVVSVESSREWAELLGRQAGPNLEIVLRSDMSGYVAEIGRREDRFDLVAVDGVERLATAAAAVRGLSADGVIVWDNSEEEVFQTARRELPELGEFRELRFTGFGPCCTWTWSTSVLYRPGNCLGI